MAKPFSRKKHKGRRESGNFTLIPHAVQDSQNWRACSGTGIKLLCDLARQYNGSNNGDLGASLAVLAPRGWKSPSTLNHALHELRHYGMVELTRQGGLNMPSLYAVTWHAIDDCKGKLDCSATMTASGDWKEQRSEPFKRPQKQKASTESVSARYGIRSSKDKKAARPIRNP